MAGEKIKTFGSFGYLRLDKDTMMDVSKLYKMGLLPWHSFIVDAYRIIQNPSCNFCLSGGRDAEIVLDLNTAETGALGRYETVSRYLPWGNKDRPWHPDDFFHNRNYDFYHRMAEFVVDRPINVVLSPSHLSGLPGEPWLQVDIAGCHALRTALDQLGGGDVAIDYLLMAELNHFVDAGWRSQMIEAIRSAPFERLWVRIGEFGHRYDKQVGKVIGALLDFRQLGRPIIVDMCGGLAGLSLIATGVVAGIAHGVGIKAQKVSFSSWMKPPPPPKKEKNVPSDFAYVSKLDGYMKRVPFMDFFQHEGHCKDFGILLPDRYFRDSDINFLRDRAAQFEAVLRHAPENRLRQFQGGLHESLWELKQIAQKDVEDNIDTTQIQRAHGHMSALDKALTDVSVNVRGLTAAASVRAHRRDPGVLNLTG